MRARWHGPFQPTLPARGATKTRNALPAAKPFQPTLPARGATSLKTIDLTGGIISTHAPRTGSDVLPDGRLLVRWEISTHAPRTGSDNPPDEGPVARADFNPRSPHGERPSSHGCSFASVAAFQPTLPARGATTDGDAQAPPRKISTHAPRTGSDTLLYVYDKSQNIISTHAPRTGSDEDVTHWFRRSWRFQPTLPARGATGCNFNRRESRCDFNPRSPHGERLMALVERLKIRLFQPTLPARGATPPSRECRQSGLDFNPRSPHGERRHFHRNM